MWVGSLFHCRLLSVSSFFLSLSLLSFFLSLFLSFLSLFLSSLPCLPSFLSFILHTARWLWFPFPLASSPLFWLILQLALMMMRANAMPPSPLGQNHISPSSHPTIQPANQWVAVVWASNIFPASRWEPASQRCKPTNNISSSMHPYERILIFCVSTYVKAIVSLLALRGRNYCCDERSNEWRSQAKERDS